MYSNRFDIISPEDAAQARETARRDIISKRRRAAARRLIASRLDNAYVTKALVPKLKTLFPEAAFIYISQQSYGNGIDIDIQYHRDNYKDKDCFHLCSRDNRRIDATALIKAAEGEERSADALEEMLSRFDILVGQYNTMAEYYAEIHHELYTFFHEIPYADYSLERDFREYASPEAFEETLTA